MISEKTIGDYCCVVGCSIIRTWEQMLVEDDLADACFDFLDPARAHHSRNSGVIAHIDWFSAPTNPRVAALAECYAKGWSLLAGAALRATDARQIIETPIFISIKAKRPHPMRPAMTKTCLLLLFFNDACLTGPSFGHGHNRKQRQWEILAHLAPTVGWESLLLAAVVEHNHGELEWSTLDWMVQRGADVNSCPCRLTPLQAAVQLRDPEAVKILLKNGADVNAVGSAAGYQLPGTDLSHELALNSPLRILRTASCAFDGQMASRLERKFARTKTTKATLEKLLVGAGARDFTASP